jgi:NTE family protein
MLAMADLWWDGPSIHDRWYGVFQGGGAKGVAYAGALVAFRDQGLWFKGVAGASAGAITAALIAAGYKPEELAEFTGRLLKAVRPATRLDTFAYWSGVLRKLTRYSSGQLEIELDRLLRKGLAQITEVEPNDMVSFQQLYDATGIELDVVALDSTERQPIVFNAWWTPDIPVSTAVVASCAIPIAFDPRFLESHTVAVVPSPALQRVIVDGGAWANYPDFVFRNESVRRYHGMPDLHEEDKVIGFVLRPLPTALTTPWRFVPDPYQTLGSRAGSMMTQSTYVSSSIRRDTLLNLPITLVTLGIVLLSLGLALGLWWLVSSISLTPVSIALLGLGVLVGLSFIIALLVLRRALVAIVRIGIPTAQSLLGQATGVAAWVGAVPDDLVIRLDPGEELETTHFNPKPEVVSAVVEAARKEAVEELEHITEFGVTRFAKSLPEVLEFEREVRRRLPSPDADLDTVLIIAEDVQREIMARRREADGLNS